MKRADKQLIKQVQSGDRAAFSELVGGCSAKLRSVIRRIVGHPDDTDELFQDTLLKAWNGLDSFRGDAEFSTWLCAIGARSALDFLRASKPWRERAQIAYANECAADAELGAEVGMVVSDPSFTFDVHEHISYCFGCVGRSLPAEQQVALVMREVLALSAQEAADAIGLTEAAFKHQLSAARERMTTTYEGLCSLVNKAGVCYQCKGLRMASANARNDTIDSIENLDQRIDIVRRTDLEQCVSKALHDVFWRRTAELEDAGRGSSDAETDCGRE